MKIASLHLKLMNDFINMRLRILLKLKNSAREKKRNCLNFENTKKIVANEKVFRNNFN